MKLLIHVLKSTIIVVIVVTLAFTLFAGYRYLTFGQKDNSDHIAAKQLYLDKIKALKPNIESAPNIIFFLYDDMGYGDIGAGAPKPSIIKTPNFDQLAQDGVSLTDFYSPSSVCTPSRAGYLTGRLATRAGLPHVVMPTGSILEFIFGTLLNPDTNTRLPEEEITIANVLKAAGYRTGIVGKWHMGDRSPSLPNDMGFDLFFGSHHSNDMTPFALYRNEKVEIPAPADQRYLTEWYTDEAIRFIELSDEKFFLYFAHNFPHDPLHAHEEHQGQSDGGLYGDVLEEIDEGIGQIIETLRRSNKLDNTLIIISSDNGPWYQGSNGDFRGRKGSTFDGGQRVPFIAHWPQQLAGGKVENSMAMGIDLFPTILNILKLPAPDDRIIDGKSMLPILAESQPSAHDALYFIAGEKLISVRDQKFKYRSSTGIFYGLDGMPLAVSRKQDDWLFDLRIDNRESYDTSLRHPEKFLQLREIYESKVKDMAENPRGWK